MSAIDDLLLGLVDPSQADPSSRSRGTDDNNTKISAKTKAKDKGTRHPKPKNKNKKVKGLTVEELKEYKKRQAQKGVVYVARVPPYLNPQQLRDLLAQYGKIERIYLTPEDPLVYKRRKKSGRSGRKSYIDGWVEFADKRVAKLVALSLNNTPMGGGKGSKKTYYREDLWNLKYLSKFRWDDLTSQISAEKAAREQKVQAEIRQTARENNFYLAKVEQAKTMENIKSRKAKGNSEAEGETGVDKKARAGTSLDEEVKRTFRQRKDATEFAANTEKRERDDVLTKLFTNKGRGRVVGQRKTTSDKQANNSHKPSTEFGSVSKRGADPGGVSIFSRQAKKSKVT